MDIVARQINGAAHDCCLEPARHAGHPAAQDLRPQSDCDADARPALPLHPQLRCAAKSFVFTVL